MVPLDYSGMSTVTVLAFFWMPILLAQSQDRVAITVLTPAPSSTPVSVSPSGSLSVRVRIQNTGSTTFTSLGASVPGEALYKVDFSYRDANGGFVGVSSQLPVTEPVAPGSSLEISGEITVPAASGRYTVLVSMVRDGMLRFAEMGVIDPFGADLDSRFVINVAPPALRVVCNMPPGAVGEAFSGSCSGIGGTPPYRWTVAAGELPPGITLNTETGGVLGAPTLGGSFVVDMRAIDSSLPELSQTGATTITVAGSPITRINCTTPPARMVGQSYESTCTAVGGALPFRWSATTLPPGITLSASGVLSGVPTAAGTFLIGIVATGSTGAGFYQSVPVTIDAPSVPGIEITCNLPPSGQVGSAYSAQCSLPSFVLAAIAGIRWTAASLPPGLAINAETGLISGTPILAGTFATTVTAFAPRPIVLPNNVVIQSLNRAIAILIREAPLTLGFATGGIVEVVTSEPVTRTMTLRTNRAQGDIFATVTPGSPWLVVSPSTVPVTSEVIAFQLRIVPPAEPGQYRAGIVFEQRLSLGIRALAAAEIRLTVPDAPIRIEVSRDLLSFAGADAQTLEVASSSGPPRAVTVAATGAFLRVAPLTGTTPFTINVSAATEGRDAGTYDGAITLTASGVINSPLVVPVKLTLTPATQLIAFPTSLALTGSSSASVRVESNGAPSAFRVATNQSWLTASSASRTTPAVITVSADTANLTPGSYTAEVTVFFNNDASRITIPVRLTVPPPTQSISLVIVQTGLVFNHQINGEPPPAQDIVVSTTSGTLPIEAGATVTTPAAGRWLRVTPETASAPAVIKVNINPIGLDAAVYEGTVTIRAAQGGSSSSIPVRLVVSEPVAPSVKADPELITFAVTRQGSSEPQQLHLTNPGRNLLRVELETETAGGGNWLKTSTTRTDVNDSNPSFVLVEADPAGLEPGTYKGSVRIRGSGANAATTVVPVLLNVSAAQRSMRLSHSGLSFTAIEGFGSETQNVWVLNVGQGLMSWSAAIAPSAAATSSWLTLIGANGSSGIGPGGVAETPNVLFAVNAAGLRPGEYYSEVIFRAPDAENGSQSVGVTLRVLPKGSFIGMAVEPSGVIFTSPIGGPVPSDRQIVVFNKSGENIDATLKPFTLGGGNWLTITPELLPLRGNTNSGTIRLRANPQGLQRGTYEGRVTISFPKGINRTINVLLVVYDPGAAGLAKDGVRAAGTCTPTRFLPLLTSLEDQFVVSGGSPIGTEMLIVDDCGNPAPSANLGASFSNGDPARSLISPELGRWNSTWVPSSDSGFVTMRIAAIDKARKLDTALVPVTGLVAESLVAPVLAPSQTIRNAASGKAEGLVGPGSLIEIYGLRLATETVAAGNSTLPATLASTSVTIGDKVLPLVRVAPDRISALVPEDIPAGQLQHLTVRRGQTLSTPHPVLVALAAPGIFRQPESEFASASVVRETANVPITPAAPARPGDLIEIVCTGLGAVTQSGSVRARVDVMVGAASVRATDTLDRQGRYLVRFTLPVGTPAGTLPLRVSTQGVASEPVILLTQ